MAGKEIPITFSTAKGDVVKPITLSAADIDILKNYLKTQHAPKAAIETLEGLTVEQHVSWKRAVERIKKLLNE